MISSGKEHPYPIYRQQVGPSGVSLQVLLSRPAYRIGETVVGTIRLLPPSTRTLQSSQQPREFFESAQVYVAGRCRIDPRWHNPEEYKTLYGEVHPYLLEYRDLEKKRLTVVQQDSRTKAPATVCVWSTNVVELLNLEERHDGNWNTVKPMPLTKLQQNNGSLDFERPPTKVTDEEVDDLQNHQLAFTFRADIPTTAPPSISLNCGKYFYSVVVGCKALSDDQKQPGELLLVNVPFEVLSCLYSQTPVASKETKSSRVQLGLCQAIAHSNGLPYHVTIDEICEPMGHLTVNRNLGYGGPRGTDTKELRVTDPHGRPCCIMTAIGTNWMSPGSNVTFVFDFPVEDETDEWVRCHKISGRLQGVEMALYETKRERRARYMEFDSHEEAIYFGYTETTSFSLLLPLDAPISMRTDLVRTSINCVLELTVDGKDGRPTNLKMELPIQVIDCPRAGELDPEEEEGDLSIQELLKQPVEHDHRKPSSFPVKNIQKDLKILSLILVDEWKLVDRTV